MPLINRDPKRPSLPVAAVNYAMSVARETGVAKSADEGTQAQRWEACRECEMRVTKNGNNYCGQPYWDVMLRQVRIAEVKGCGCELSRKIRDPRATCPEGRWQDPR